MSISDRMTSAALLAAKSHVANVAAQGGVVTLIKGTTKDKLGTILTETTLTLNSHPTRFSPFDNMVKQKISWAENVNVIFYIAKLQVDNLSLTLDDIKRYMKVRFEDKEYEVAYAEHFSSFGTDCLYVIIGAKL